MKIIAYCVSTNVVCRSLILKLTLHTYCAHLTIFSDSIINVKTCSSQNYSIKTKLESYILHFDVTFVSDQK